MFFVVRSNDSFNFPLGLIKYIVIVIYWGFLSDIVAVRGLMTGNTARL